MTFRFIKEPIVLFFAIILISGCATYSQQPPIQTNKIFVKSSDGTLSAWTDVPSGSYVISDSQVVVSGHQSNSAAGILFGAIGAQLSNASTGADLVKDVESKLKIKLDKRLMTEVAQSISRQSFSSAFQTEQLSGAPTLIVMPTLVMTLVSATEFRPSIVLQASLVNAGSAVWETRYISISSSARTMTGAGGWFGNDAALDTAIAEGLRATVQVMLRDISKPYPRDEQNRILVTTVTPYMSPKLQIVGLKLGEDDSSFIFTPLMRSPAYAGVFVLKKDSTPYRPASKDDSVIPRILPNGS